ncbi:hypothetical protein C0Z18_16205 [Trinickia dabaoshanensis]|uniref:Uncharacterized protein n=2 Tax=Trinickia dabaoshanensis TaxID=564714 RepID=A0A2N7VP03_9BURK|nr:hypothetical protein C0Z18_16205 [Trinickia dabaoshanensis]
MANHERFHVVYDGPALEEHRMDVRDLAPALVAFADLFAAVNKEVNGDAADVRVQVNASFKAGSFGVDLVATQHLVSQLRDIFSGTSAAAISNAGGILALIGMTVSSGYGLIQLLLRLAGRKPVRIEQKGDIARVWINQTETVEVERDVVRLYRNSVVRSSLEKVVSPLERDGIDDFGIVMNGQKVLDLHTEDLPSFSARVSDADAEVVSDATARKLLQIESLTFKDGNKWRVSDGNATYYVAIEDKRFLAKIDAGERFGKGDVLLVDLRQVQTIEGGKLVTESMIVEVIEHRQPLQQSLL